MHKPYRYVALGTLALALVSLLAAAAQSPQQRVSAQEARSADLLPNERQRALSVRAHPCCCGQGGPDPGRGR